MSLTRPIPEEATSMAELIRETVKRPEGIPAPDHPEDGVKDHLRWPGNNECGVCPMGLLPGARSALPCSVSHFDSLPLPTTGMYAAISTFYLWWDEQEDAAAAVDAVWGKA